LVPGAIGSKHGTAVIQWFNQLQHTHSGQMARSSVSEAKTAPDPSLVVDVHAIHCG